jgi:hypothetical protein
MSLFRLHHDGDLSESIVGTIIVKDVKDLLEKLAVWWSFCMKSTRESMFHWQLKIDPEEIFDSRCGWYTHLVSFQVRDTGWMLIGMVSEPLDKDVCCSCGECKEIELFN